MKSGETVHGKTYIEDLVTPGAWSGKRCFVVGGGPSLRDFDFSLLDGELTIGVNRAYESFIPTINVSMDPQFYGWAEDGSFGERAKRIWNSGMFVRAFLEHPNMPYPPDIARIRWDRETKAPKWPDEKGMYPGPNSGYAAIMLVAWLGCKEIYVLGLDCGKGVHGEKWYHDGYKPKSSGEHPELAIPYFEKLAPFLENAGVKVMNLSLMSQISAWPRRHWSSVFNTLFVKTYLGFGDNMYSMPFIRRLAEKYQRVYIETPWPQLYQRIPNARFVRARAKLHAQDAAENAWTEWVERPQECSASKTFYESTRRSALASVPERFAEDTGYWDIKMNLDIQHDWIDQAAYVLAKNGGASAARKQLKLCVVKQPTFRKEWYNETRNPKPEHIQHLVNRARAAGYFTVSVADLREGEEWTDGPELDVDLRLHRQELDIFGTVGLVWLADLVIGYPCFFIPLGLSLQKRMIIVYGGCIRPAFFKSEKLYDLSNFRDVAPEPFCHCGLMVHNQGEVRKRRRPVIGPVCNKEIPTARLDAAFNDLAIKRQQEAIAC